MCMHTFNATIAGQYGVNGAIMVHNIHYWVNTNRANDRNLQEGRYWTYNSVKAFDQLFPYWTSPQIRRILDKLVSDGAILKESYNKVAYDQTKWYTLSDKVLHYYDQIHLTKLANGLDGISKPIPDSKPDSKPKERKEKASTTKKGPMDGNYTEDFEHIWELYPRKIGKAKAFDKWKALTKEEQAKTEEAIPLYAKSVEDGEPKFIKHLSTWLNQRVWEDEFDVPTTGTTTKPELVGNYEAYEG